MSETKKRDEEERARHAPLIEHLESGEWPRIGMVIAALRSRPAPPDDLERKHRVPDDVMMLARAGKLIDAIKLLRHDFGLPLKEAKLLVEDAMRIEAIRATAAALAAPAPVAAPAPPTAPQMLNENPVIAAKTRAVMQQIALNNMTTVEQCPGLLAFGPIYRALAAPAPETPRTSYIERACGCVHDSQQCRAVPPHSVAPETPAPVDVPACPDGQHSYRRNAPPQNGDVCFVCRKSIWWETPAPDAMPEIQAGDALTVEDDLGQRYEHRVETQADAKVPKGYKAVRLRRVIWRQEAQP